MGPDSTFLVDIPYVSFDGLGRNGTQPCHLDSRGSFDQQGKEVLLHGCQAIAISEVLQILRLQNSDLGFQMWVKTSDREQDIADHLAETQFCVRCGSPKDLALPTIGPFSFDRRLLSGDPTKGTRGLPAPRSDSPISRASLLSAVQNLPAADQMSFVKHDVSAPEDKRVLQNAHFFDQLAQRIAI
jgi:hypothetical protein